MAADLVLTVTKVEVAVGAITTVRKYADYGAGNVVVVKSETDLTTTELGKYFESRGWYYTGHRREGREHIFGYAPKPGATRLTVKASAWICGVVGGVPNINVDRARDSMLADIGRDHPDLSARDVAEEYKARLGGYSLMGGA